MSFFLCALCSHAKPVESSVVVYSGAFKRSIRICAECDMAAAYMQEAGK